mgnify:FL=1
MVAMSSCQDEMVENPATPAQTGAEITFGSSLTDLEAQTRTIYGDEPVDGAYPVYWVKGDEISIYCPEASNGTLVNYWVTPNTSDSTTSSAVTKVNPDEAGLQWGAADIHHFYGFYPASAVTGTENGKIKGYVPPTQNVDSWNPKTNTAGGINYYGKTNTDLAYMWAYGTANRSTMGNDDVRLTFHPWMTVVQIKLPGPESGELKVSNFNIRAIKGSQTILTGDFICDMNPVEAGGNAPNYEAVGNTTGEVRNTISISGWNAAERDFITLKPNDTLIVRAYLLPVDEAIKDSRELQIRVQPLNGAVLTRTLGYSNAGVESSIVPHKVNTVILPRLRSAGTNYWMSSLDRGIYLSELSIPGSKFSYLTPENAGSNAAFQGETIEQQFLDGVRGFIVQVGANATYEATRQGWGRYDCTYTDATLPIFCGGGDNLSDAITHIAKALETAETSLNQGGRDRNLECAVVMITYAGDNAVSANFTGDSGSYWGDGGPNINNVGGAEHVWMDAIANELKQLGVDAANRIYIGEITANTTLDDVKGKIILKVNTNSDAQNGYIAANDDVPALFSRWNGATNTVPLRWGSPNTNSTRTPLNWMYQEATHVGTGTEITPANKYAYAIDIFTNSVGMYEQNDAHDTWFMNDCGGTFHGDVSGTNDYDKDYGNGDTNDEAPIAFARWFNPQITSYLQQRDENASLGLVFFNFADKQTTGQQYGTDNLIQTIIDNNFKFDLRKRGSSTDTNNSSLSNSGSGYGNGGALIK